MANGQHILTGYTKLLESGQYNSGGEWATRSTIDGQSVEVIHLFSTTGTWKLDGNKYSTTVMDFKSQPKELKRAGQPGIDLRNPLIAHLMPKLEDLMLMPLGLTQEFEIVELTSSTLKVRGKDLKGIEFLYEGVRQ